MLAISRFIAAAAVVAGATLGLGVGAPQAAQIVAGPVQSCC